MPQIHIIRFPYSCYKCGSTIQVTWPFNEELTSPEPLGVVGEELRAKEYAPVQVVNGAYAII